MTDPTSEASDVYRLHDQTWLLQIETGANQQFIFDTNKLRLQIGGSQLLYEACTRWVTDAIDGLNTNERGVVHSLVLTSGRALLASDDREALRQVLQTVSLRVLREAPGLNVTGAVVRLGAAHLATRPDDGTRLGRAMRWMSEENERLAGLHATTGVRFPQLPMTEICAMSGLPTEQAIPIDGGTKRVSAVVAAKAGASERGRSRLSRYLASSTDGPRGLIDLDDLGDAVQKRHRVGWLAMLVIDGSGIGGLFIGLGKSVRDSSPSNDDDDLDRQHLMRMQALSSALHEVTDQCLKAAIKGPSEDGERNRSRWTIPIVAGGDDIVVICAAHVALDMATDFLEQFEKASQQQLESFLPAPRTRLSASIGIAVFKPHFPVYSAHHLAEQLIGAAKSEAKASVANPRHDNLPSTVDVHILADSMFTDLDLIRGRRTTTTPIEGRDETVELWGGPYLAGDGTSIPSIAERFRTVDWLRQQLAAIAAVDEDGHWCIPRRGLHRLRFALAESATSADRLLGELRVRPDGLDIVGGSGADLVVAHPRSGVDTSGSQSVRLSNALLDLLDFVDALNPPAQETNA